MLNRDRSLLARKLTMTLDRDLVAPIEALMEAEQMDSPAEAIRQLIRRGMSAAPVTAAEQAAKYRAFNETRRWAYARLNQCLKEMSRELEAVQQGEQ